MAQKLILEEDIDEDFNLIAIHCSEEAYKVAYLLNQNLKMRFKRKSKDLDFSDKGLLITFPLFEFDDTFKYTYFYLLANKCKSVEAALHSSGGLFSELVSEKSTTHYLLSELPKVDYFLKIYTDSHSIPLRKMISEINEIKQVISAYAVDITTIKSKNNLIFD
ncbi:IPExxxVDY family protein [Aequorivita echinoideorum]|uniref:IPExxxVDY family protein n=1 Tax=Aequorivita echinoideorum TaxID=1549647 RepID=A0ABS5S1H6_9FLAO|nr:IPExxxVDY family protein [Aequorivita echinoideorum]MBT0607055.1 IPExxxVDY family protein [Aequorivita echinoideorum]